MTRNSQRKKEGEIKENVKPIREKERNYEWTEKKEDTCLSFISDNPVDAEIQGGLPLFVTS